MKKVLLLSFLLLFIWSCEEETFDCEYVSYDKSPGQSAYAETYRSSWDASCDNELLDESVFTHSDGTKTYSRTVIECK